ncbi:hypothetical protein KEM54_001563 [Ascosphaera aggregata]|nr:hypothetical protein KEM54_001563 [Ascosphaera aggregata]
MSEAPLDLRLTLDERFSDIVLRSRARTFHVHKVILCARSKVLASIIEKNPTLDHIEIDGFDDDTVARMVDSMYRGDYTTGTHQELEPAKASDEICARAPGNIPSYDSGTEVVASASASDGALQQANSNVIPEALVSIKKPVGAACIHARVALIADDYCITSLYQLAVKRLNREWTHKFALRSYIMMLRDAVEFDLLNILVEGFADAAVNNLPDLVESDEFQCIVLPPNFTRRLLSECSRRQEGQSRQLDRSDRAISAVSTVYSWRV